MRPVAEGAETGGGLGGRVRTVLARVDDVVRRHAALAVPVAVFKKFGDDRGGQWAALVAYYGFFSLFPLLLAFTMILGLVVQGNEELQDRILDSALSQFPIIGEQIRIKTGALQGSAVALVVGVVTAVWAGMGVVLTLEDAMDDLWDVPRRDRPDFVKRRVRALLGLVVLGVAAIVSSGLAALGTTTGSGWLRVPALVGTVALQGVVIGAAFRYLTVAPVTWRATAPGAITAAVGWTALLALGSWLVGRQLREAEPLYGFFAIVLGLLSWIYLGAQLLLLSAELNVVLSRRLWPRSLQPPPLTEPDRQALSSQAEEQEARPEQDVHVHFDETPDRAADDPPDRRPPARG